MAAVVPPCAATFALIVFVIVESSGHTISSEGPLRNLAEAAAMGSSSEVVRLLAAGEDPNRMVTVRPYVISSSITRVTALEAAVWYRSALLMKVLDRAGAIVDRDSRDHLTCLAGDLGVDEIVSYLSPKDPPRCVPGETLDAILARSKEP
ncbi:MAG TPA: hypothetical protein VGF24_07935 [Vicinamibacterales bacterium]|jgi:hypothetical protein